MGEADAKAKGRLRGRQRKLTAKQEAHLAVLVATGQCTTPEVAELFGVGRSTVYRAIDRAGTRAGAAVDRTTAGTPVDARTRWGSGGDAPGTSAGRPQHPTQESHGPPYRHRQPVGC